MGSQRLSAVVSGIGQSDVGRRLYRPGLDLTIDACLEAIARAGLDPATVSLADMEGAFYAPGALALRLGPAARREELRPAGEPRFSWSRSAA